MPEDVVNSAVFMPEATHGSAGRMNPCTSADADDDADCESYEEPSENNTKNATSDVESSSSDDGKEGRNRRVEDLGGGAESDDDVVNDTDGDVSQPAAKNPRTLYNLAACLTLLRRTKEIDSTNQQGAGRKKGQPLANALACTDICITPG